MEVLPLLSTSVYWKAQPMPVASGPSVGTTPSGSRARIVPSISFTRLRAQYMSVPSSKIT